LDDGSGQSFVLYLAPPEILDVAPAEAGVAAENEGIPDFAITLRLTDKAAVFFGFEKFLYFFAGIGFRFDVFGRVDAKIAIFGRASYHPLELPEIVGGRLAGELICEKGAESLAEVFGDLHGKDSGFFDEEFELIEASLEVTVAWSFVLFDKFGIVGQEIVFESVVGDEGSTDRLLIDDHLGFLRFEQS
jgi:hypothetical protein